MLNLITLKQRCEISSSSSPPLPPPPTPQKKRGGKRDEKQKITFVASSTSKPNNNKACKFESSTSIGFRIRSHLYSEFNIHFEENFYTRSKNNSNTFF
jgi:hypothetical protein